MAITTSRIRSNIYVSYSSTLASLSFTASTSSTVSLLAYSSLLYTVPSGKIAKVITNQFGRGFTFAYGSLQSIATGRSFYISALGVHTNNSLTGIPQQARYSGSSSTFISGAWPSVVMPIDIRDSSLWFARTFHTQAILNTQLGEISYQNMGFEHFFDNAIPNSYISFRLQSFVYAGNSLGQKIYQGSGGANFVNPPSIWSTGPDHCYLSSGEQLIASINFAFSYGSQAGGIFAYSYLHAFASLEFDYLVIEDDIT